MEEFGFWFADRGIGEQFWIIGAAVLFRKNVIDVKR